MRAELGLQLRIELRFLAGLKVLVGGAEITLCPDRLQRKRFAVQPVGRPVWREIAAVPPDRAQLLAAGREPGLLALLHLPFGEENLAVAADHLRRNGRRVHENLAANPAQAAKESTQISASQIHSLRVLCLMKLLYGIGRTNVRERNGDNFL